MGEDTSMQGQLGQREEQLFVTLQKLLQIQATEVKGSLEEAAQLVADMLSADKVDIWLHEPEHQRLVALGVSDTVMGRRQRELGLDVLSLANKGRTVEVFQTGMVHLDGRVDEDEGELVGFKEGLGVRSTLAVPLLIAEERRGVLMVASANEDAFDEQDKHFLLSVAHWLGILTHRAQLVEQLTHDAAEQARRVAADTLLTMMAHDVRNYLTPIKGRIDLLQRRFTREKREQDLPELVAISKGMKRVDRLLRDLLDVARLEKGIFSLHKEFFNLTSLLEETIALFKTDAMEIELASPAEIAIFGDPEKLRQAVENLLSNAIKYAPKGTPVRIDVTVEGQEEMSWAVLRVSNQGKPIPESLQAHLFEPFVSGSTSTGLGLGLYLSNQIIQAHHGTLDVNSHAAAGTTFEMRLPVNYIDPEL